MRGVIKNKVYIPAEDFDDNLLKMFEVELFKDQTCLKCPYKKDKPNGYCEACDAYEGTLRLWERVRVKGVDYVALPSGNLKRLQKITGIDFSNYKECRVTAPFEYPLKWTGHLREGEEIDGIKSANQKEVVEKWLQEDKRYGFIVAPPRTGKSIIGVYLSIALGCKTLFVAHQSELLDNFMESWERDTNLLQLREETGKPIVKIIQKPSDFEGLDVALVTYQKFIRPTSKQYIDKYIKGKFGFVVVDEAHQAGAAAYAKFMLSLDCRYKLGLSATPMRKDTMNRVLLNVMGPVTVKSNAIGMVPRVEILETGVGNHKANAYFSKALKSLQEDIERNKIILKEVIKDLQEHKSIIIPVDSKAHLDCLVKSINNYYGEEIAAS